MDNRVPIFRKLLFLVGFFAKGMKLWNIFSDAVLPSRYHCCTSVGVHSVALPWLGKIDAFIKADDENKEILSEITTVSVKLLV